MSIIKSSLKLIFLPYFNRLRTGEGGLLVFSFLHIFWTIGSLKSILIECILAFFVICMLYGYNDFVDRKHDSLNPRKDQVFVSLMLNQSKLYLILYALITLCIILFSYQYFNLEKAFFLTLLLLLNSSYSHFFKSVPILDVIITSIWGGMFFISFGKLDYIISIIVAVMTGIAHIYQTSTDMNVDAISNIKTSSVAYPNASRNWIWVLTFFLSVLLLSSNQPFLSLSTIILILIFYSKLSIQNRWNLTRLYFVICFLLIYY